jgi:hypothetical protein
MRIYRWLKEHFYSAFSMGGYRHPVASRKISDQIRILWSSFILFVMLVLFGLVCLGVGYLFSN